MNTQSTTLLRHPEVIAPPLRRLYSLLRWKINEIEIAAFDLIPDCSICGNTATEYPLASGDAIAWCHHCGDVRTHHLRFEHMIRFVRYASGRAMDVDMPYRDQVLGHRFGDLLTVEQRSALRQLVIAKHVSSAPFEITAVCPLHDYDCELHVRATPSGGLAMRCEHTTGLKCLFNGVLVCGPEHVCL